MPLVVVQKYMRDMIWNILFDNHAWDRRTRHNATQNIILQSDCITLGFRHMNQSWYLIVDQLCSIVTQLFVLKTLNAT